ncbi:MAG: hypothetical protein KDA89_03480, partial [Planctomycetaceae bacterium]|nr:hypothetical protein [Planctomycetaceae bacterium]
MLRKSLSSLFRHARRGQKIQKRSQRRHRTAAASEVIETRQLLTVFTWDAGGDGVSFADKDNWAVDGLLQPDAAPGINDDLIVDFDNAGTPFTIRIFGDEQVNSITIDSADAVLRMDNGTSLTVTTDTVVEEGRLLMVGGTLATSSMVNRDQFDIARTATVDSGAFENHGDLDIVRGGGMTATFVNGFTNHGAVRLQNSAASGGGIIALTVQNGAVVNEVGGTITLEDGTGARQLNLPQLQNDGRIDLLDQDVRFAGNGIAISNSGVFTVGPGVIANTLMPSVTFDQAGGSLNVDGRLQLNNGTLDISGGSVFNGETGVISTADGSITISGGALRNDGTFTADNSDVIFSGGDVIGLNPLNLTGNQSLDLSHDGSFSASVRNDRTVRGELAAGQSLTVVAGNSGLILEPGFVNRGELTFDNPDSSAQSLRTSDGSPFENAASGVLRFTRSASETAIGTFIQSSINNAGAIEVDTIVSDSKLNALTNTGSFTVTAEGRYTRSTAGSGTIQAFVQAGGTVTNNGRFDGGGLTFSYEGGTAVGEFAPRDLVINDGSGNSGIFRPTSSFSGDIQSGQTVLIDRAGVDINSDLTNA